MHVGYSSDEEPFDDGDDKLTTGVSSIHSWSGACGGTLTLFCANYGTERGKRERGGRGRGGKGKGIREEKEERKGKYKGGICLCQLNGKIDSTLLDGNNDET